MHFSDSIGRIVAFFRKKPKDGERIYQEKTAKIEKERDEFRRKLANCKTKEEVHKLKTSKAMELQMEALSTSDSEFIVMRMMTLFNEFDIPDDEEEQEFQSFLMQRIEQKKDS